MKVINKRIEPVATKLGENKLNYIVKDDEKPYYRIYLNDGYYVRIQGNDELINRIKEYTWVKEKKNNSIKSNSDSLNTVYLNDFLYEYRLPKYEVVEGNIEDIIK
ncbi:hypothetical protein ACQX0N_09375 [Clostridium tepidum]